MSKPSSSRWSRTSRKPRETCPAVPQRLAKRALSAPRSIGDKEGCHSCSGKATALASRSVLQQMRPQSQAFCSNRPTGQLAGRTVKVTGRIKISPPVVVSRSVTQYGEASSAAPWRYAAAHNVAAHAGRACELGSRADASRVFGWASQGNEYNVEKSRQKSLAGHSTRLLRPRLLCGHGPGTARIGMVGDAPRNVPLILEGAPCLYGHPWRKLASSARAAIFRATDQARCSSDRLRGPCTVGVLVRSARYELMDERLRPSLWASPQVRSHLLAARGRCLSALVGRGPARGYRAPCLVGDRSATAPESQRLRCSRCEYRITAKDLANTLTESASAGRVAAAGAQRQRQRTNPPKGKRSWSGHRTLGPYKDSGRSKA